MPSVANPTVSTEAGELHAALLAKPDGSAAQRRGHGDGVLVAVQLAVGQAAVVVQDADHDGLAGLACLVLLGALAGGPVPGPIELGHPERVDVQQRARVGPLVATMRAAFPARSSADPVTLEHLPVRQAMPAGQPRQPHRPPIGLRSGVQDRLLLLGRQRPRTRPGDRPPRRTPASVRPLGLARGQPPVPRRGDRRRRAPHRPVDGPRVLAGEHARHHLTLRPRSEPASTVCHVRPSLGAFSLGDRQPPTEAGQSRLSRSAGP